MGVSFFIQTVSPLEYEPTILTRCYRVIEVNVGIICACSLALPTFIKRYWPKDLSTSKTRLVPATILAERSENFAATDDPKSYCGTLWSRAKASENRRFEYVEFENRRVTHGKVAGSLWHPISTTRQAGNSDETCLKLGEGSLVPKGLHMDGDWRCTEYTYPSYIDRGVS